MIAPPGRARRSSRQSLQSIEFPGGHSSSNAPSSVKPSLRQIAFDGPLSTEERRGRTGASSPHRRGASASAVARVAIPPALELGGEHGPTGLIDLLAVPLALPVADPPRRLARRPVDDLERGVGALVACLALGDLLGALRPAEVFHHRGITDQPLEERQVVRAPHPLEPKSRHR